ncbi:TonB-dependent receptor plug domain-containing protein [Vibrio sp. M60_M31a]
MTAFSGQANAAQQNENPEMERAVVTASLTQHSELTAPGSVSVITAEDIAKMPVKDISEAVRSATGVSVLSMRMVVTPFVFVVLSQSIL